MNCSNRVCSSDKCHVACTNVQNILICSAVECASSALGYVGDGMATFTQGGRRRAEAAKRTVAAASADVAGEGEGEGEGEEDDAFDGMEEDLAEDECAGVDGGGPSGGGANTKLQQFRWNRPDRLQALIMTGGLTRHTLLALFRTSVLPQPIF